ncbi:MAG: hypothetical protein ACR2PM_17070 [Hyphomicrobiales bacterium]
MALLEYWYFHIPNFVLAALMYTLAGRFVLGLFVPDDWDNYIWRAFVNLTQPVANVVGYITPMIVPDKIMLLFAIIWLLIVRIVFFWFMLRVGLAPVLEGGS